MFPPLMAAALWLCASPAPDAQPVQAQHARVELIPDRPAVTPGGPLTLGVHFQMEQGWHIYWRNPGDSGQPPVLQWRLPSGASAGEVEWPRPQKLHHGEFADFGYENEVTLLLPLRLAPGAAGNLEIGLQAKWLICREICIPDHAQLHLSLPQPANPGVDLARSELLVAARKLIPKPWPKPWKIHALSQKDSFVLSIATGKRLEQAQFFPFEPNQIENAAPQPLDPRATGGTLTLKKSDQLLKPISRLNGVLVIADAAYRVEAPVTTR